MFSLKLLVNPIPIAVQMDAAGHSTALAERLTRVTAALCNAD